jgi:hypothetical protein
MNSTTPIPGGITELPLNLALQVGESQNIQTINMLMSPEELRPKKD